MTSTCIPILVNDARIHVHNSSQSFRQMHHQTQQTNSNAFARNFKVLIIHPNCCQCRFADYTSHWMDGWMYGWMRMALKLLSTSFIGTCWRRATRIVHNTIPNIRLVTNIIHAAPCVCVSVCVIFWCVLMQCALASFVEAKKFGKTGNTLWHWFRLPFWLYFRFGILRIHVVTNSGTIECCCCICVYSHAQLLHMQPIEWWMHAHSYVPVSSSCLRLSEEEFSACQTVKFCAQE